MWKNMRVLLLAVLVVGLGEGLAAAQSTNDDANSTVNISSTFAMICTDTGAIPVGSAELIAGTVTRSPALTCTVNSNQSFNITGTSDQADGILKNGLVALSSAADFAALAPHAGWSGNLRQGQTANIWTGETAGKVNELYNISFAQAVNYGNAPGIYTMVLTFTMSLI